MRKRLMKWTMVLLSGVFVLAACDFEYDDTKIWERVNDLEKRVKNLESQVSSFNSEIASIQRLVNAVNGVVTIKNVVQTADGYVITFSDGRSITLTNGQDGRDGQNGQNGLDGSTPYIKNGNWWIGNTDTGVSAVGRNGANGRDGQDGRDGLDGQNGQNGADGLTPYIGNNGNWWIGDTDTGQTALAQVADVPVIGVQEYDGRYYWTRTINGVTEFLTDNNGNKLPVTGEGSVRPILTVDSSDYWKISYDGGITFEFIYDTFGSPVKQGSGNGGSSCTCTTFFQSVTYSDGWLILVLVDGQVVKINTNGGSDNPGGDTPNDGSDSQLGQEYFIVEGGQYYDGSAPGATTGESVGDVTVNDRVLSGGLNFVTVRSNVEYIKFYIYVRGIPGYYVYVPSGYTRDGDLYVYTIPLLYSEGFTAAVHHLIIVGVRATGETTTETEKEIIRVDSQSGDLNINLTFSQAKDVDLHLYLPDERHIYYGNRGYYYTNANGEQVQWGLDHDSNAGCNIDNLNNENIFIPAEAIQAGTYTVKLDMYSNCSPRNNPTYCQVVARYKGALINNTYGDHANPVTLTYDTDCGNGDYTTIMQFTITEVQASPTRSNVPMYLKRIEPSDMDLMKMEEAEWRKALKQ